MNLKNQLGAVQKHIALDGEREGAYTSTTRHPIAYGKPSFN